MIRFRMDNTQGYLQSELDELNRRYVAALTHAGLLRVLSEGTDDIGVQSFLHHIAESVQSAFDCE